MHTTRPFTNCVVFLTALIFMVPSLARAADGPTSESKKEKQLLAVLRSDAPASEKAITCKLLAIHGSSEAVPDLAKLLPDPQLSSWARIALEAIPGAVADQALRTATKSLQGKRLIGTINSIGVRRDAKAVKLLTARLQDKDSQVASAAAAALGQIGNAPATKALREALADAPEDVKSEVALGCVLCAERLYFSGKTTEAAKLYDEVRTAKVPKQRIIEATRGVILARGQQGIPLLIELFSSPDKKMFQLALGIAREFPGSKVDKALAAELVRAKPQRAALIVQAMADRKQTVVLSAVLAAAQKGPKQVRLAAIDALSRAGDESSLSTLMEIGLEADSDLSQSAKATLAKLPGEKIDSQIVALLPKAKGKTYLLLLELVGLRRIAAVPMLLKALDDSDKTVRNAALLALGETITPKDLSVLIELGVATKNPEDALVAKQALKAACVRMPDREACASQLAAAIDRSSSDTSKVSLLEILGAVGGTKALATMSAAAKSSDPQLQDVSTRLLGKWMTADAAPVLLDLTKTAPGEKYQVRALRGYIRIARQFVIPMPQRVEMCKKAYEAAQRPEEQKLVLEVLGRYPNGAMLRIAFTARQVPELKAEATQAVLSITGKLSSRGIDVGKLIARLGLGLEKVKLEIVKAQYGSGSSQMDVTAKLRQHAGDLRWITLPSNNFNTSFGRDPSPGSVKRLTIEYRINGKAGEASFAENSLILLPVLK